MAGARTVYEAYLDGELVARGTKEECAERVGVKPETIKAYACPSKSRPSGRIRAVRLEREEAERRKPFVSRRSDPRISSAELLEAMRRRRDAMLGLDCNAEWEL